MKNELKQELTRRLCACNNGGLVLVMYDIYFGFSDDVKNALMSEDREALRKGVSDVQAALDELMGALDFKYPLQDSFIHCTHNARGLFFSSLSVIMKKLRNSFETAAADDKSAPLMDNAQKVYAGMTYGRGRLTESFINDDNRGFLA